MFLAAVDHGGHVLKSGKLMFALGRSRRGGRDSDRVVSLCVC